MLTVNDLIVDTEQTLLTGQGEQINEVATTFTTPPAPARQQIFLRDDVKAVQAGGRIAIDFELFRVWSVDTTGKSLTVVGEQNGSVAATHNAGAMVIVNPKFPRFLILRALQAEVRALSSPAYGMWRVYEFDLPTSTVSGGYPVTGITSGDIINLHRVYVLDSKDGWIDNPGWSLRRNLPTASFPSGAGLFNVDAPSRPLRAVLRARFGELPSSLTAEVTSATGVEAFGHDILTLGAALRLYSPRELKRGFTEAQALTSRASDVPATAQSMAAKEIRAIYRQRISEYAGYLSALYPTRFKTAL